jgi:SAM-dependent methyltransferase
MATSSEPSASTRLSAAERERIEIEYWRDSPTERPGAESLDNLLNKMAEAKIFVAYLDKLRHLLVERGTVVELGAGQGWGSCIYKKRFPEARVVATDLSAYAIESIEYWHRIFGVRTDEHYACKSYATQEAPDSVDLVYCFAAAHHFADRAGTLAEIARILKPGGRALFLHEPVCGRLLYPLAYRRVNAVRPEVPEDLLITADVLREAAAAGLEATALRNEPLLGAAAFGTLNYRLQRWLPPLARVLPSSMPFVCQKPAHRSLR